MMEELIPITMFMCIAAVAILRPISSKLGHLLEAMTRERIGAGPVVAPDNTEIERIRVLVEHVSRRMDLIEERLDFTERLVGGSHRTVAPLREESARPREEYLRP
jgi:hypothetical protein